MRLVLAAATLTACAGASSPPTAPVTAGARPAPAEPTCAARVGLVAAALGPASARWSGAVVSAGDAPIAVRLCGAGRARVIALEVGEPVRWQRAYEPGLALVGGGAAQVVLVPGTPSPSIVPVRITAVDEHGRALTAVAPLESKDDPARAAARAACDACGGTWGAHGMLGIQGCDCPTADAGRPCTAPSECTGVCIATGWERVADEAEATCPAGRQRMRLVGHCSARTMNFGCHPRLSEPTTACQLADGPWVLPTVCGD